MIGGASVMQFDWSLLGAPLLAGLLVVSTHVALGREVLKRGIIFIDLTIAQIAALGVIACEYVDAAMTGWHVQIAGGTAALLAAGVLAMTERRWPALQEALIGCLYVIAASEAILLLANNPHGAEHFTQLLAGQILWVTYPQLIPIAVLYAVVLMVWFGGAQHQVLWFYPLFALSITASVQLVGVYLVFASLILPALAGHGLRTRTALVIGYGVGALGYAAGLVLSVPWDLPSGPLVVCCLAVAAMLVAIMRRE